MKVSVTLEIAELTEAPRQITFRASGKSYPLRSPRRCIEERPMDDPASRLLAWMSNAMRRSFHA